MQLGRLADADHYGPHGVVLGVWMLINGLKISYAETIIFIILHCPHCQICSGVRTLGYDESAYIDL